MGNYRINVLDLHYAINTAATNGAVTRGTPTILSEAMKIGVNPKMATGQLYGNGSLVEDSAKLAGSSVSVDATRIPTDDLNKILGRTKDENGITRDNKNDSPANISVGWRVELSGKQSEFIWFTNCKAQFIGGEVQQSEDNVKYSTDTIVITAMPDENGDVRLFGETIDPTFKYATTWFASVPPVPPVTP